MEERGGGGGGGKWRKEVEECASPTDVSLRRHSYEELVVLTHTHMHTNTHTHTLSGIRPRARACDKTKHRFKRYDAFEKKSLANSLRVMNIMRSRLNEKLHTNMLNTLN